MSEEDHYHVLKVSHNATAEEIKSAYRKLAKKWHPDLNSHRQELAEKQFKLVNSAYQVLGDESKRIEFDQLRNGGYPGGHPMGGHASYEGHEPFAYRQAPNYEAKFRGTDAEYRFFYGSDPPPIRQHTTRSRVIGLGITLGLIAGMSFLYAQVIRAKFNQTGGVNWTADKYAGIDLDAYKRRAERRKKARKERKQRNRLEKKQRKRGIPNTSPLLADSYTTEAEDVMVSEDEDVMVSDDNSAESPS